MKRLPSTAHTSRPWRIHDLTRDFRLEDVWQLPVAGGPDDFPRAVRAVSTFDPSQASSRAVRALFTIRARLGERLGLDRPDDGVGSRVASLRERLPADLRDDERRPGPGVLPFEGVYSTDDEWVVEVANRTVHGLLHLGWVADDDGGFHAQLAVLVKPNGLLGTAYLVAIRPFRYLIVYPQLAKEIEHAWRAA